MLEKAGFTARIGTEHLFVSVHDAVTHAVGIQSDVSLFMSLYWYGQQPYKFIAHSKRKEFNSTGLVWDSNMATILLFWDTNMVAMT